MSGSHFPAPPDFERNTLFLDQMRHFLAVARGETPPVCTLEDGIAGAAVWPWRCTCRHRKARRV